MSIPWTEKYRPRRVSEVIGNEEAKKQFEAWIRGWERGSPEAKAALLAGPPGTGKTSLVLAYASEHGYEVVELNASDERSSERLKTIVGESARQSTLSGTRKRIIMLDEVDGIAGREAVGGVATISSIIKSTKTPIVMIANDPWDPRLAPLRENALMIKFNKLKQREILAHLKKIIASEGVSVDEKLLAEIVRRAEGDMRSAINDVQILCSTAGVDLLGSLELRDRKKTAFEVLSEIFGATSAVAGRNAVQGADMEVGDIMIWVGDNILNQIHSPQAIADAFKLLADADLHYSRVRRLQRWELLRYVSPLLGAGPGVMKQVYGEKGERFEFPSTFRFFQQTRHQRTLVQSVLERVASRCKMSRVKVANEMLPFLAEMFRRGERGLASYFGLTDEEVRAVIELAGAQPSAAAPQAQAPAHKRRTTPSRQTRGVRRPPSP
ncbi:MAG: replication factor C large subunit [Nitrososphaerota archaeon]|nr:replication factor C large subunit [Candidatus Calditenuaceae archaeon]MDW8073339.1 replication factor C large subunit [Nitrososphaerota archaeon]